MEAGAHPAEPIVCLDDLQSEEAMLHPLEQAVETVVEAFADSEPTRFLARPGHECEYMRALLSLSRAEAQYEVHECGDFGCVALVHEVPPLPAAQPSESGGEDEASQGGASGTAGVAAGRRPPPPTSRAEASANVEPGVKHGKAQAAGGRAGEPRNDPVQLRAAAEEGSLDALLALGLPRLQAELVLHARPDRLRELRQVQQGLDGLMEQHAQEHGPLLHLHFLATRPSERGRGRGNQLLHHLERMADAEGRRLYLEATSPDNRRLYLRHGFQDVDEFRVESGQDSLTFYLMIRPPGAKSLPPSAADLQAAAAEPAGPAAGSGGAAAQGKGAAAAGRAAAVAGEGTLLRDEV